MSSPRLVLLAFLVVLPFSDLRAQQASGVPGDAAAEQTAAAAPATPAQPDFQRASKTWNVEADDGVLLALQGWDPVACFPEGGGKARKGNGKLGSVHGGVTYRFASEEHRQLFLADPWKYEPAYGGWCAYAMAEGDKVEIDPESFRILDGRLFVFYDGFFGDTRAKWLKDEAALLKRADAAWTRLSGELNRGDAARAEALRAATVAPAGS